MVYLGAFFLAAGLVGVGGEPNFWCFSASLIRDDWIEYHVVAALEPLLDLDDLSIGDAQFNFAPLEPALGFLDGDMVLAIESEDRLDRHGEYIVEIGDEDVDLGRHSGSRVRRYVFDLDQRAIDFRASETSGSVGPGRHGFDDAAEFLISERIDRDLGSHARSDLVDQCLVHFGVHQHRGV